MRQPLVVPTSMNSMKRRMWPLPRKWRAIVDDVLVVDAALDDHVDLHRRQAGGRGVVDSLEHLGDREADVVHRPEGRVVEGVEADGDALRPAALSAWARSRVSSEPFVVIAMSSRPSMLGEHGDELLDVAAQQRLAAGEADLAHAVRDRQRGRRG